MSKYLSVFQTESQYNAAAESLDYPHVSLIDTTGDIHYSTYIGQEVVDAPFGSILMAEVATNKLFYIEDSADYNLTDYPFADYKPIAVCIYDKASNANNLAVFMSLQWMDAAALGQGNPSSTNISWGFNNVDMSAKVPGIRDKGTNHISSRVINAATKPLVTVDYSGTSYPGGSGDGASAAFCSCWRYSTPGTSEGEWYLPSYYDIMKYNQNYDSINAAITNIKNAAGTSYLNTVSFKQWIGSESSSGSAFYLYSGNKILLDMKYLTNGVRAVFIAGPEEI